ncbi:MAG: Dam family site-specific DNA-(adenine-N6)-methyltransferase [Eubacteriales bacterium]|nr:Dam family site-specific DNA-(adenine-N6)-methyltransferase [Eubacteriales bacterium]
MQRPHGHKTPKICDSENLRNIHQALRNVTIVCGDYSLSKSFIDGNTFVYLDPPYRPISEISGFTAYTTEVFDDKEQVRLSEFIDDINLSGAKIVLSNSDPKNVNEDDNFFENLYKKYKITRVEASRAINSKGDKRGKITELLICN